MAIYKTVVAAIVLTSAGGAVAQSTSNCIRMAGGMVHCDTMGANGSMSSTNCNDLGGGMTNCSTMPLSQPMPTNPMPDKSRPRSDGFTTSLIGDLIGRSQERSFQKKLRKLLDSGDCQGAANLAFAYERDELSNEIRKSCQSPPAPAPIAKPLTIPKATITIPGALSGIAPKPQPSAGDAEANPPKPSWATGPAWVEYATGGTGTVYFYDSASIKELSDHIEVWVKADFSKDRTEKARSSVILYELYCRDSKIRLLQWIDYSASGSVMDSNGKQEEIKRLVPGSIGIDLQMAACR